MTHTIILMVNVVSKDGKPLGAISKELESVLIPAPGMDVEDGAWHESKKIIQVTLDFEEETYTVDLEPETFADETEYEKSKPMYTSHEWKVLL